MTDKNYKWIHIGGGTDLVSKGEYPCDDQYEHVDSKKTFNVLSTIEAHQKMPERVRKPSDLKRWVGVKSVSKPGAGAPKGKISGDTDEQESNRTEASPPPTLAPVVLRIEPGAA